VGYKCPDCAREDHGGGDEAADRPTGASLGRWFGGSSGSTARARPSPSSSSEGRLPTVTGARGTVAGLLAAVVGGLLLGPILTGGTFFLISSGVIGWGVARAVFWATAERSSPYLRAIALTAAGFSVAVGLVTAGTNAAPAGLAFLAYPAAMYGGWIVVRQR
jgi:hypothetical protein